MKTITFKSLLWLVAGVAFFTFFAGGDHCASPAVTLSGRVSANTELGKLLESPAGSDAFRWTLHLSNEEDGKGTYTLLAAGDEKAARKMLKGSFRAAAGKLGHLSGRVYRLSGVPELLVLRSGAVDFYQFPSGTKLTVVKGGWTEKKLSVR